SISGDVVLIQTTDEPNDIVQSQPAGTTFLFEAGTHRLTEKIAPRDGDVFLGAANHATILSGAKVLTGWTEDSGVWYVDGQTQGLSTHGQCQVGFPRCDHPEELFIDDVRMKHVDTLGEVTTGTWHFDYTANRIYIGDDPTGVTVETSVVEYAIQSDADDVVVKGLTIEKFANPAQHGAVG